MSDLQSMMAASAWRQLVERRRRRNRARRITMLFIGAAAVSLLVVGILHMDRITGWAPLSIQEISFSENRIVGQSDLLDLLGVQPGDPWWDYDSEGIERRVAEHPRVAKLDIQYAWFHELSVVVEEREAALVVLGEPQGELTRDGWCLPMRAMGRRIDLPILQLPPEASLERGMPTGLRETAVARLIGDLRHERPDLWKQISEVQLVEDHARVYLRPNNAIILYSPGFHEDLWRQVPTVLENLHMRGHDDVVLDLRFKGKIVVRLPEASGADTLDTPNPRDRV